MQKDAREADGNEKADSRRDGEHECLLADRTGHVGDLAAEHKEIGLRDGYKEANDEPGAEDERDIPRAREFRADIGAGGNDAEVRSRQKYSKARDQDDGPDGERGENCRIEWGNRRSEDEHERAYGEDGIAGFAEFMNKIHVFLK